MPLTKIRFRPGINRDLTQYAGEGGWYDCDKIRFRQGYPETIGGWERYISTTLDGICRSLYRWVTLDGASLLAAGTNTKLYIARYGQPFDVTPIRATTSAGDVTFAANNGSATITVTDTSHGATVGDFVTFSGAASLGGNITADILNAEHQITAVNSANEYEIVVSLAANSSDSGNGGASVVGAYQLSIGLSNTGSADGYGTGGYGLGGYGEGSGSSVGLLSPRTWTHDNFGEDLVSNPSGGNIYYWDASAGLSSRAVPLSTLAGADSCPTIANAVLVSDQDRHIVALGCDSFANPNVQDAMLVRWSDQENAADWRVRTTNTSGEKRLDSGSKIITAIQSRREIVIFTDIAMYAMQFVGPPFIFGFQELSRNVRIVGPKAGVAVEGVVFWMEAGRFMQYDGMAREIPCPIKDHVFDNLNKVQANKVVAGLNSEFSEVWWFYPVGLENDHYVIYNYAENVWSYGTMNRTAWLEAGILDKPIACDEYGQLYEHETGLNDASENPPVAIRAYVESASIDIGDGNAFFFMNRVIPDLTFSPGGVNATTTITISGQEFPGQGSLQQDDQNIIQSQSEPISQYTKQVFVRVRGRSFIVRMESNEENTGWRLGDLRFDYRTDGRR